MRLQIVTLLRARLHGEFQAGLKFCCDYMMNFSPGAKRKFALENLLRCENTIDARAHVPFSARPEISLRLQGLFAHFSARLAGLKILALFLKPG